MKKWFKIRRNLIILTLLITFAITSIFALSTSIDPVNNYPSTIEPNIEKYDSLTNFNNKHYLAGYYEVKQQLIRSVDDYIHDVAPKSKVSGKAIVEACLEQKVDISIVLAQGQVESHFGTTGVAARTNGVFNVGANDGRSVSTMAKLGYKFSHPDQSITPYITLLKEKYLVNGKTESDLLKNYVNKDGHRYATSLNYEKDLCKVVRRLEVDTDILHQFRYLNNYKNS